MNAASLAFTAMLKYEKPSGRTKVKYHRHEKITINGVSETAENMAAAIGISWPNYLKRRYLGWSAIEALTTKKGHSR